ncbi:MAG: MoaD/ThiS family protein [Ginsengibacter sp.]
MKVLAFGIVKDIFNNSYLVIDNKDASSVDELKAFLEKKFPALKELASYMIAINEEYASENIAIKERDEIAIIPPVSGG